MSDNPCLSKPPNKHTLMNRYIRNIPGFLFYFIEADHIIIYEVRSTGITDIHMPLLSFKVAK